MHVNDGDISGMTDKELEYHNCTFHINANQASYHHASALIVCLLISPTQCFEPSSCAGPLEGKLRFEPLDGIFRTECP